MKLLHELATQFRKNRKIYIFFICFAIAAMFWLLIALTKEYESSIRIKVVYENYPPHMLVINALPEKLLLNIKTSGYHLIPLSSFEKEEELKVDVLSLTGIEAGSRIIASQLLIADFVEQLGSDIVITSVQPDSILFELSPAFTVKLPVKVNMEISFEKQFDSVSSVKIIPDSINIKMPISLLGKIKWIETEKIQALQLRESLKKKVKLLVPLSCSLSNIEAEVNLEVQKFTEASINVPVKLLNVPRDLKLKIFPDRVAVKYLVALSSYDKVKPEMFTVVSDASTSTTPGLDKLEVHLTASPAFVRSVSCQPSKVDFILKK